MLTAAATNAVDASAITNCLSVERYPRDSDISLLVLITCKTMQYLSLISSEIFPIPVGDEFGREPNDLFILYSPFTDNAILVTEDYLQKIDKCLDNPSSVASEEIRNVVQALTDYDNRKKTAPLNRDPRGYTRMAILPNNVCNFRCSYCYSAHGRSGKVLDKDILKASLDNFIDNKRVDSSNKLAISILGGGEPLLSWDLVQFIIEYSNERSREMGFARMDINLVTNGSVFTQEIIDVLKEYRVPVSISFEILEEIQNLQRGHYEQVCKNIDWIISEGIRPQLRACITLDNLSLMKRMIEEVLTRFPGTREVMMEYVTDPDRLTSPEQVRDFYRQYLDNFFEAHDYAAEHGLLLDCSAYRNFNMLLERFCPGDNTLTPYGEISVCSRVGAPADAGYSESVYGRIGTDGIVEIDEEKYNHLIGLNVHHYEHCRDCWAKWHCAGGCMYHKFTYNEAIREEICVYNRNFTKRMLLRGLDKEYRNKYGITLKEMVAKSLQ